MKNIKKFHVLHVFLIFMLITSSVLGVFACVKTCFEQSNAAVITPEIGGGGGKAATAGGSKYTTTGYNLNNVDIVNTSSDGVYDIPEDVYKNNTKFIISDWLGLKKFAGIVNSNDNNNLLWDGFKGKTIYLNSDIDCGGKAISIGMTDIAGFGRYISNATFDGQNHTISNVKLNQTSNDLNNNITVALFKYIGPNCKIKNFRLKNIIIPNKDKYLPFAGLVGEAIGTGIKIKNCIVEGISAEGKCDLATFYGMIGYLDQPLFGTYADLEIENSVCDIRGVNLDLVSFYAGFLFSGSTSEFEDYHLIIKDCIMAGFSVDIGFTYGEWKDKHEIIDCKKEANDISGLTTSSVGGNKDYDSSTWYYAPDYNDGFPCLRQFVDNWKYVYFKTANGGSVSPSSILVPIDANKTYIDSSKNTITVYDRDITATRPSSMCEHTKASWSRKEETISGVKINTYTCTFTANTRTIKFLGSSNTSYTTTQSFTVICCSSLRYAYVMYPDTTDKFKSITYTFITSNGDEKQVKYSTVGIMHYISGVSNEGADKINSTLTISVETKLKSYNVQIE